MIDHEYREKEVRGERGQKLRERLDPPASFGRSPIQTPTGTQISVASAISTTTRASVMSPYAE